MKLGPSVVDNQYVSRKIGYAKRVNFVHTFAFEKNNLNEMQSAKRKDGIIKWVLHFQKIQGYMFKISTKVGAMVVES